MWLFTRLAGFKKFEWGLALTFCREPEDQQGQWQFYQNGTTDLTSYYITGPVPRAKPFHRGGHERHR
jgi:hypothetical protein